MRIPGIEEALEHLARWAGRGRWKEECMRTIAAHFEPVCAKSGGKRGRSSPRHSASSTTRWSRYARSRTFAPAGLLRGGATLSTTTSTSARSRRYLLSLDKRLAQIWSVGDCPRERGSKGGHPDSYQQKVTGAGFSASPASSAAYAAPSRRHRAIATKPFATSAAFTA